MAATVTTYPQHNAETTKSLVSKIIRDKVSNPTKALGIIPFKSKALTVIAGQVDDIGDETYAIVCPPNALLGDYYANFTDLDSAASPLLTVRLQMQTTGGTETVLSANTAIAAGATTVALQGSSKFLDCSGQSLGWEVTAAADTFAAGTFYVYGYWIVGTSNHGFVYYN